MPKSIDKYIYIKNDLESPVRKRKAKKRTIKDQIQDALKGESYQVVFISSTKGAMKLAFKGHHYKYSFKRNNLSIYQCSYIQNDENGKQAQCKAKVVVRNERAYEIDQEHCHVDLAFDKSTTPTTLIMKSAPKSVAEASEINSSPQTRKEKRSISPIRRLTASKKDSPSIPPKYAFTKEENSLGANLNVSFEQTTSSKADEMQIMNINPDDENDNEDDDSMSPEDFRKKIKARLSRFLLKK
ncbi:modifier of mdg4 [Condylostylus longicornis]|uniref:modifier of mdg4 n=1 Tax=Condylostylus longicornis TaxID=2530218 RepID=UPI00244E0DC6|nr:modifier of mdg4 [Condylostylus longicornis]